MIIDLRLRVWMFRRVTVLGPLRPNNFESGFNPSRHFKGSYYEFRNRRLVKVNTLKKKVAHSQIVLLCFSNRLNISPNWLPTVSFTLKLKGCIRSLNRSITFRPLNHVSSHKGPRQLSLPRNFFNKGSSRGSNRPEREVPQSGTGVGERIRLLRPKRRPNIRHPQRRKRVPRVHSLGH